MLIVSLVASSAFAQEPTAQAQNAETKNDKLVAFFEERFKEVELKADPLTSAINSTTEIFKNLKSELKPLVEDYISLKALAGDPIVFSQTPHLKNDWFSQLRLEIESSQAGSHRPGLRQEAVSQLSRLVEQFQIIAKKRQESIINANEMESRKAKIDNAAETVSKELTELISDLADQVTKNRTNDNVASSLTAIKLETEKLKKLLDVAIEKSEVIKVDEAMNLARAYSGFVIDNDFVDFPVSFLVSKTRDPEIRRNVLRGLNRVKGLNRIPLNSEDANLVAMSYFQQFSATDAKVEIRELDHLKSLVLNGPTDFIREAALSTIKKIPDDAKSRTKLREAYSEIYRSLIVNSPKTQMLRRVALQNIFP
jgi:hypothetical protein